MALWADAESNSKWRAYTVGVGANLFDISGITLAILAGGEGSRMGVPKGLIRIGNQPILEFLLDRLKWPGPKALITAPGREHPPGWQKFDAEVVDPVAGLGPLRGVLTALEHATTEWVAVITVDMPGVRREQIEDLIECISVDALGAVFERLPEAGGRFIEPFPLLVRTRAAGLLEERIGRGKLSVVGLIQEEDFSMRAARDEWKDDIWRNLNRPDDLQAFLRRS